MNDEPSGTYATRDDLAGAVRQIEERLSDAVTAMKDEVSAAKNETKRHFDVAVENIVEEMRGANHDMLDLLRDKQLDHEDRISVIERQQFGGIG